MSRGTRDTWTVDLFAEETSVDASAHRLGWPESERFPLKVEQRKVRDVVLADLLTAKSPLIVTGHASLDKLIDFIAECREGTQIRILMGSEPFASCRESCEVRGHFFRAFRAEVES